MHRMRSGQRHEDAASCDRTHISRPPSSAYLRASLHAQVAGSSPSSRTRKYAGRTGKYAGRRQVSFVTHHSQQITAGIVRNEAINFIQDRRQQDQGRPLQV